VNIVYKLFKHPEVKRYVLSFLFRISLQEVTFYYIILIQPETRFVASSLDGNNFFMTSDDFKSGIANNQYPPADNATVSFSNFVAKASRTTGWATYDIKMVSPNGKEDLIDSFRGLEKIGGAWKIITGSEHQ
jgi:hypothetical protein